MQKRLMALSTVLGCLIATTGNAQDQDLAAVIERGHSVAIAGDCMACHRTSEPEGKPFAGGYTIDSPMGPIVAPNISPSKEFGIGNWTEEQFADAVRNGVAPRGNLYPAMPYTAYRGVSDSDIHALYIYLTKGIDPVDEAPRAKTNLPFPFNQRVVMAGWNLLFNNGPIFSDADANAKGALRGKYLAETLAHCSTCHTPRNVFMAEDASRYLGGGDVGGWHAPNITSDPVSGIGGWTNEELIAYLKNGNAVGKSQAAGPMAEAVEHSFRHMPEADLMAIAEYLKTVPPLRSEGQTQPAFDRVTAKSVELGKLDYSINYDPKVMANGTSSDGQEIYVSACATCHQLNGNGTADHFYPSLTSNRATGGPTPNNLVMAIVEGVHRKTNGFTVQMPAFKDELSNAQIAAVSNYVLSRFGNDKLRVTEADVLTLKKGGDTPLLIKATPWLMGIAAFSGVLLILAFVGFLIHRRAAAVPSQV